LKKIIIIIIKNVYKTLTITANICAVRLSGVSLGSRPALVPFDAPFPTPAPSKS